MANMISDIYDAILENISCQRSLLVPCSIRIRQFNGKTKIFICRRFVFALNLRNESNVLIKIILYLKCLNISTTYLFLPCDFKRRLTEPLRDKVLYGTCLRECVFVS